MIDNARTTLAIAAALRACKAKPVEASDPCMLFKAKKNATELEGARNAHLRDGAALCRFLAWLDAEVPSGKIDELTASDKLEAFRRETGEFQDVSFDTISGAGSNGAIVHYRATPETNKKLLPGALYLIDSGAQYLDGTTDVTRTVAIGEPTGEMRRHYTLVLKGHIGIATARFPAGTRGVDIDGFARRALWAAGLNYGHGTGHGIGSFLSVHEGPQSISPNGMAALEPGMIVSNEPGYYREGHYGIRLENLCAITEPQAVEGGEEPVMGFETLTLAPFDRRLIVPEMLDAGELGWLNAYHARVRQGTVAATQGRRPEVAQSRHSAALESTRFRWNQKRALSFSLIVRLYRNTASHFSGRTPDLCVSWIGRFAQLAFSDSLSARQVPRKGRQWLRRNPRRKPARWSWRGNLPGPPRLPAWRIFSSWLPQTSSSPLWSKPRSFATALGRPPPKASVSLLPKRP